MNGPQTINEQRMAKAIQELKLKVNNLVEQQKKENQIFGLFGWAAAIFAGILLASTLITIFG